MEFNATFLVSLFSFCIFILLMNKILYAPIDEIVKKRKTYIDDNNKIASENASQKEAVLNERVELIKTAHNRAKETVALKKEEFKKRKNAAVVEAKNKANEQINNAASVLEQEQKDAHEELKHQIVGLAQMISDKFIETDLKVEKNDELISKVL